MEELGLDEALEDGAALIEWPERAEDRLPADALTVHLLAPTTKRRADLWKVRRAGAILESTYV